MKRIAIFLTLFLLLLVAIQAVYIATLYLDDFQDSMLNAARDGDTAKIQVLLAKGKNPNRTDGFGNSPLSIAAHYGQKESVALLLENGASINGLKGDMTPLQCAVYSKHPETAAFLLENDADPNIPDENGITALAIAARNGDARLVKLLLDFGANIEQGDEYGWRPLHIALRSTLSSGSERFLTVKTLLEYGADPNANNVGGFESDHTHDSHIGFRLSNLPNRGNKPILIAESNGFTTIVELLKQYGGK